MVTGIDLIPLSKKIIPMNNKNTCDKCYMSKDSDYFWEAHQTMQDGRVWCVNAKRA